MKFNNVNGVVPEDNPQLDPTRPNALVVDDIGIQFNLNPDKVDNFKEFFIKGIKNAFRKKADRQERKNYDFWALRHISFTVKKGERLGIMGINGAGKSTLLKIISGVYKPTEGSVKVSGVIAPLLELGAGFDGQYTGSENIYLYGATLGYSREYIEQRYDQIVEFSELKKFMDVPLKNYSSGMKARLGFAIATAVDPDILILDEVLSVGDAKFRKKSEAKVVSMFNKGVTVLFVSHNAAQVRRICDNAILIKRETVRNELTGEDEEYGKLIAYGTSDKVADVYEQMTGVRKDINKTPDQLFKDVGKSVDDITKSITAIQQRVREGIEKQDERDSKLDGKIIEEVSNKLKSALEKLEEKI